jgi:apolipoprotein N-acyltransferase
LQAPLSKLPHNESEATGVARPVPWPARLPPKLLDATALLAGSAMPLAFAPFKLWPLAVLMPALLYAMWLQGSGKRAAWRGFLFGSGMYGIGTSWVYVSLHNYGNMPVLLAGFVVALFTAALAAFPALAGWLQAKLRHAGAGVHLLLVIPALWVICEWLHGWVLTGFPWLDLGYTQVSGPLAGYGPWLGVYGVSWAVALTAALLVYALRERGHGRTIALVAVLAVWVGGWSAGLVPWAQPAGAPLRVALVQGDVPIGMKWRPEYRSTVLQRYLALSTQADDAALIVWPEAALPTYLDEIDPVYLAELRRRAREHGSDFLIGVVERDLRRDAVYNSVISIGSSPGIYRKRHLVPLGEYLPFKSILSWLLNYLQIPMSDFSRGAARQPAIHAAGHAIGVSVCYEDAFGAEVIRELPQASLLVNVSEDAWFGDSLAPHQRLQMARMRAIESARPMLRAANTGLSAIIDAHGRLLAVSPQFRPFVLIGEAQPMQGATPFVRYGNWTVITGALLILVIATAIGRRAYTRQA